MAGSRAWQSHDRTGGAVDAIIDHVRAEFPGVRVERMVGTLPADDDNVYWLVHAETEVQVDTDSGGELPVIIGIGDTQAEANTITDAILLILQGFGRAG